MKRHIICILVLTSLCFYINAQTLVMTSGNKTPCPNSTQSYRFELHPSPQAPYGPISVKLTGGKFTTGETIKNVELNVKNAFSLDIEWGLEGGAINVYERSMNFHVPILIRNLRRRELPSPTISGTGSLTSSKRVDISSTHLEPLSYKTVCTINIPYGAEGSTKIKVSPIAYSIDAKTTEYRWKINGIESSYKGDTYTLTHDKINHIGTQIIVTARNSCASGLSDSNPIEFTITRNGLSGLEIENITNQNIKTDKIVVSTNTINVKNSSVTNNAKVKMIAGKRIVITPNSKFSEGTNVHFSTRKSGFQLLSVNDNSANILDSELSLPEFSDNYYYPNDSYSNSIVDKQSISQFLSLSPNPTDGIIYFNCSDYEAEGIIKIYSTTGALVYTNTAIKNGDSIDLSFCSKGLYLVRIEINGEISTEKIILK